MGAYNFEQRNKGRTAEVAFGNAQADARDEYGHGGYSGTIAEKDSFTMIPLPKEVKSEAAIYEFINKLINDDDERIEDKWGPAGCVELSSIGIDDEYIFFGWASS